MVNSKQSSRLLTAPNLWLATVRPNGAPHLVPIWFVWVDNTIYICTASQSVKARNIADNPRVAISLEDGSNPLVLEGTASFLDTAPSAVVQAFAGKYDWNIENDSTYNVVIAITPRRVVLGDD